MSITQSIASALINTVNFPLVYNTNQSSDELSCGSDLDNATSSRSSAIDERQSMKSTPHMRSKNVRREAFGASDEELCDPSDVDSVLLAPPQRRQRSEGPRVISTRSAKSSESRLAGKTRKSTNNSVAAKAYKRKRDSTECSEDGPNSDKLAEDAVANKRSKTSPTGRSALCTPDPPERTESQVLQPRSTAATRATNRYHGEKEKICSPTSCSHMIDYGALPESDPFSSTRNTLSPLTALFARRKKADNKPALESKAPQSSTTKGRPHKAKLWKTKPSPPGPIIYQGASDDDPLCDRHELSDTFVEDEPVEETKENQSEVKIKTHAKHVVPALAASASTTDKRVCLFSCVLVIDEKAISWSWTTEGRNVEPCLARESSPIVRFYQHC